MRISQKPTDFILVRAYCQSEWDNCDFAIIACGKPWVEWLQKRLDAAKKVQDFDDFLSLKFFDDSAAFYVSSEDEAEALLSKEGQGKDWAFVELEEGEEDELTTPESRLKCHALALYNSGNGRYIAYGKHTGEEYYTDQIPFVEVIAIYAAQSESQ